MSRAAVYTRISDDPKSRGGKAVNVATQEKDARTLAASKGHEVLAVFTDNDLTAADPQVIRPGFEALLERCLAGDFDVVLVYTQDRFVRMAADLERVIGIFTVAGVELVPVIGTTDFESPEGKLYARFNTLLGSYEVEKVKLRVQRKMQDNAEKGLPPGGAAGYGFNPDKLTVNEDEAARIREAARRIIAGDALRAIVGDWNTAGITMRGRRWSPGTLARVLQAPRIAGLRLHQGREIGKAAWPAILDRETFELVRKVLSNPARRSPGSRNQKLLTGLLLCGKCGAGLNHKWDQKGPRYFCRHCFGTLVASDHVEAFVVDLVVTAMDSDGLRSAVRQQREVAGASDAVAQVVELEDELVDLANEMGEGRLTMAEWKVARAALDRRIASARSRIAKTQSDTVLTAWAGRGGALRDAWDNDLSQGERRAIIDAVFESITVAPARRGRNWFDPERVQLAWRF